MVHAYLSNLCCTICFLTVICLQKALSKLLLFDRLEPAAQAKVVEHTWMRSVAAGEILIQEGETGLAATELYVVKSGTFEVGRDASWSCQLSASACRTAAEAVLPALRIMQQCLSAAVTLSMLHTAPTSLLLNFVLLCHYHAGVGASQERQHARQHQGARGCVRRGVTHVQLPPHSHCSCYN
jgi:hypothetical protein